MATFSGLPNEILLEIWGHVLQPEDIESFASVSKKVYALSDRFIQEHRKLKQQFSTFKNGGRHSKVSAARLLKEIIINPHVALYVKKLAITSWHDGWEYEEEGTNELMAFDPKAEEDYCHTPYAEEDMELFEQAVHEVIILGDVEAWVKKMRGGYEDPIIALILLLVTNLESLVVEETIDKYHFFQALQWVLNAWEPKNESLKRLVKVELLHDRVHDGKHSMLVKAFAALPSVK